MLSILHWRCLRNAAYLSLPGGVFFQYSIGDARWYAIFDSPWDGYCFQYSIGDATARHMRTFCHVTICFQYSIGDALRLDAEPLEVAALSILHWRCLQLAVCNLHRSDGRAFQYSIGDAQSAVDGGWHLPVGDFQYSIGDATTYLERQPDDEISFAFNTPLEMPQTC